MIGKVLAHYRILEKLGQGGMGEVYRAHDTRLGRDVAIKVLPPAFAEDPERLARFEREARVLASLNHPNIAAIHGLEQAEGKPFLVLEFVPGATLAERVAAGPLEMEEALRYALQIAEALAAAHEKGIVHRDLKPANVKVTPQDKVKVLDFGLAKAMEGEASQAALSDCPTLSVAATRPGAILGTAAYMSPERARGKPLDKRTDVWSFGCVLFEMLTGRQASEGETVSDRMASILKGEPNWQALPAATPAAIRALLRRCLQKDPQLRLRDMGDAALEIREAFDSPGPLAPVVPARAWWLVAIPWALAALLAGVVLWSLLRPAPSKPVNRLVVTLPPNLYLNPDVWRSVAISRDGRRIVYCAKSPGETFLQSRLFMRSLDNFDSQAITGASTCAILNLKRGGCRAKEEVEPRPGGGEIDRHFDGPFGKTASRGAGPPGKGILPGGQKKCAC